jgi:hypothetical protein
MVVWSVRREEPRTSSDSRPRRRRRRQSGSSARRAHSEHRVHDRGVVQPCAPNAVEVGTSERPRPLGYIDRQPCQSPNCRIPVPVGHCTWVDDHRPRQPLIRECGTQKLCVSGRSIEALIQPRGCRSNQLSLRPGQRPGLVDAARKPEHSNHQAGIQAVRTDNPRNPTVRWAIYGRHWPCLHPRVDLGKTTCCLLWLDDPQVRHRSVSISV